MKTFENMYINGVFVVYMFSRFKNCRIDFCDSLFASEDIILPSEVFFHYIIKERKQ